MTKMKRNILLVIVVLLLGLWLGVNIGRDQPLFSNPFAEKTLQEKIKGATTDIVKDAKRALRESLEEAESK